ncbi:MAG: RagB/SusD family nutrient uptake outer membrane protein [Saprospiraceae bacterium]
MRLKYFNFTLLFACSIFMFSACTDLAVEEVDSIISENEDGTFSGDPTELLSSAYKDLSTFINQDGVYSLFQHTSDEMIPPTRGTDWGDNGIWRTLHQHTWDATHAYVLSSWNILNERAFKCNQILASNPSASEKAQAKFLRAFYTYQILDLYGKVPFRGVNEGVDVDPVVKTRAEALTDVIKDLNDAIPDLPSDVTNSTTATKGAAYALLARLYLNKPVYTASNPAGPYTFDAADMNKVIEYADLVTAEGYGLDTDYFNTFASSPANNPIIFASAEGTPQNRWYMTLHYDQNPSGWNGFTTLAEFYNSFEAGDARLGEAATPDGSGFSGIGTGFLKGEQKNDDGDVIANSRQGGIPLAFTEAIKLSGAQTDEGIRVIKYHPADAGNYIFLRYADVWLMKAEAIMRGGSSSDDALSMVNTLRTARGASTLTALDEAAMLSERGRELYWEGNRRTDQVRFGQFSSTWGEKTNTDSYRVLFPIPQQAMDSNPNLTQNEGY